jgi:uncharacterized membrane protein (DUF485 family)
MKYSEKKNRNVNYYGVNTRLHAVCVVSLNRYKVEDLDALKKYVDKRATQAVFGVLFGTSRAFNWVVGLLLVAVGLSFDVLTAGTVVITGGVWFVLNMSKMPESPKIKRTNRGELTEEAMRFAMTEMLKKSWFNAVTNVVVYVGVVFALTFAPAFFGVMNPMTWFISWCALGFVFFARIVWFTNVTAAIKEIKGLYNTPFRNHSSVDA